MTARRPRRSPGAARDWSIEDASSKMTRSKSPAIGGSKSSMSGRVPNQSGRARVRRSSSMRASCWVRRAPRPLRSAVARAATAPRVPARQARRGSGLGRQPPSGALVGGVVEAPELLPRADPSSRPPRVLEPLARPLGLGGDQRLLEGGGGRAGRIGQVGGASEGLPSPSPGPPAPGRGGVLQQPPHLPEVRGRGEEARCRRSGDQRRARTDPGAPLPRADRGWRGPARSVRRSRPPSGCPRSRRPPLTPRRAVPRPGAPRARLGVRWSRRPPGSGPVPARRARGGRRRSRRSWRRRARPPPVPGRRGRSPRSCGTCRYPARRTRG